MPKRIIKDYAVRRDEILDAARQLMGSKGYEQMTIQDILDSLQIAKGTFYHYFGSKQALLEALIERLKEEAEQILIPIIEDPHLPALKKLERFYDATARWKTAQKSFLIALVRIWYMDENAIVREKMRVSMMEHFAPLLTGVIQQGVREGDLSLAYPDQAGEVFLALAYGLGDNMARLLLSIDTGTVNLTQVASTVVAYNAALEQAVGAPPGTLQVIDMETLRTWFTSPEDNQTTPGESLAKVGEISGS